MQLAAAELRDGDHASRRGCRAQERALRVLAALWIAIRVAEGDGIVNRRDAGNPRGEEGAVCGMPENFGVSGDSRSHVKFAVTERASVCVAAALGKESVGKQRKLDIAAENQPPKHRPRVSPDSARILCDNARIDGQTQRRHQVSRQLRPTKRLQNVHAIPK